MSGRGCLWQVFGSGLSVFHAILRGFFRLRSTVATIIGKAGRISTLEPLYRKVNGAREGSLCALIRVLTSLLKNMKIMAPGRSL